MGDPYDERRPEVWVGHVTVRVSDVAKSNDWWKSLGMREIFLSEGVAVLELRGGTHLVLLPSEDAIEPGQDVEFDIMVEDIDAAWKRYGELGFAPSEMSRGRIHDSFTLRDPDGHVLQVNSTHVSDKPV